jgi:hypothetical protein
MRVEGPLVVRIQMWAKWNLCRNCKNVLIEEKGEKVAKGQI